MTLLFFDRDCSFCIWMIWLILRHDRTRALQPVAVQSSTGAERLGDLDEETRLASWHTLTPDGQRHSGGDAFVVVFGAVPRLAALARLFALIPAGVRRGGYGVVARHRIVLSRLVPDKAKRRARDHVAALERDARAGA